MYVVIVENDVSEWDDETGVAYHFPKRYAKLLQPGTQVIYYKGVLKEKAFREQRLSDDAHYFGAARIGRVYPDRSSTKGDLFARIDDFQPFPKPVPNKLDGEYLEIIPESRQSNYWRDGVREIDAETYERILSLAGLDTESTGGAPVVQEPRQQYLGELESLHEGNPKKRLATVYERDPRVRILAINIHGTECKGCGFDFEKAYGEHGAGFIHVHHLKPLAEAGAPQEVDPETDVTVLCPNCHAMVHRRKDTTLSLEELREIVRIDGFRYKD